MVREDTLQVVDIIPETQHIVEKVKKILELYRDEVKFAFLFGSYAAGEADRCSDVDIGIYFVKDITDEKRWEIKDKVTEVLFPYEAQVGYLDDEDISPVIFLAAVNGINIIMNDEYIYTENLIKNIHYVEEMKGFGIIE